jgi:hypothetical protein
MHQRLVSAFFLQDSGSSLRLVGIAGNDRQTGASLPQAPSMPRPMPPLPPVTMATFPVKSKN